MLVYIKAFKASAQLNPVDLLDQPYNISHIEAYKSTYEMREILCGFYDLNQNQIYSPDKHFNNYVVDTDLVLNIPTNYHVHLNEYGLFIVNAAIQYAKQCERNSKIDLILC